MLRVRAEVVVEEDGVGLARREPLGDDLRRLLHAPGHADAARRQVAEVAAVVAAARRHEARRRQERLARHEVAPGRRGVAIRGAEVGPVDGLEAPALRVGEDARPERNAVADRDRVRVRRPPPPGRPRRGGRRGRRARPARGTSGRARRPSLANVRWTVIPTTCGNGSCGGGPWRRFSSQSCTSQPSGVAAATLVRASVGVRTCLPKLACGSFG